MFKNIDVIPQFPSLTPDDILDISNRLKDRFGYKKFPSEYGDFLQETNGCLFSSNDEDLEIGIQLKTDLPFIQKANVAGIFGVWYDRFDGNKPSNLYWPELFASNENSKENFDVLPDNMMSFAYEDESCGSLFAISTDQRDFGQVYYYYDNYMYSIVGRKFMLEKFGYCYYDQKLLNTLERYGFDRAQVKKTNELAQFEPFQIINNLEGLPKDCEFELSRNEFIPVASSFNDFIAKLTEVEL
ncbi:SMI1/KNR4 family protein [Microbulbifer sp. SSSA005]|uniref:SMI1/KNR4 family protein n=1 Tax=Microbulbifer sp. SSSA005 TaxID=3243378 RepID=UPI004039FFC8